MMHLRLTEKGSLFFLWDVNRISKIATEQRWPGALQGYDTVPSLVKAHVAGISEIIDALANVDTCWLR